MSSKVLRCISCTEDHVIKVDAASGEFQCRYCRAGKIRDKYCHLCNKMYGGKMRANVESNSCRAVNHKTCESDLKDYTSWVEYMKTNPHIWELTLNRDPRRAEPNCLRYRLLIKDLTLQSLSFKQHDSSYIPYLDDLWVAYLTYLPPPAIMLSRPYDYVAQIGVQESRVFYCNGYQYYCEYDGNIDKHIKTQSENYYYDITIRQISRPSSQWFQLQIVNPRVLSRSLNCFDIIPMGVRTNILAKMVGHLSIERSDVRNFFYKHQLAAP